MMDEVVSKAGQKALAKGISIGYAVKKTLLKEFRELGSSIIEEVFSNFNSTYIQKSVEYLIGSGG